MVMLIYDLVYKINILAYSMPSWGDIFRGGFSVFQNFNEITNTTKRENNHWNLNGMEQHSKHWHGLHSHWNGIHSYKEGLRKLLKDGYLYIWKKNMAE